MYLSRADEGQVGLPYLPHPPYLPYLPRPPYPALLPQVTAVPSGAQPIEPKPR